MIEFSQKRDYINAVREKFRKKETYFMPVDNRTTVLQTTRRMKLELHHFARGSYPTWAKDFGTLPVNRFFLPFKNPSGIHGRIEDEKDTFQLVPGRAYFAPLHHKCKFLLDEQLEFISIHFTLELYEGIDIFSGFKQLCEIRDPSFFERAAQAFEEPDDFASALQLQGVVADFAALLSRSMTTAQWESVTRFAPFKKELDHLQSRPPARITVEELAALHGVSRECFSRKFTQITGIPPKKFLSQMIISRACRALAGTPRPFREVAVELGFANEFYFSSFFRKHTGLSPKEYRLRIIR